MMLRFGELQIQSLNQLQMLNLHLISFSDLFKANMGHVMSMLFLSTVSNLIHLVFVHLTIRPGKSHRNVGLFPIDVQIEVKLHISNHIPCSKNLVWIAHRWRRLYWSWWEIEPSNLWCRQDFWSNFPVSGTRVSWFSDPCLNLFPFSVVYVHNPAFHQAPLRDMGLEKPGCVLWAKNIIQFLEPNIPRLSAFERQLLENCPKLGKSNSMLSNVYKSNLASCLCALKAESIIVRHCGNTKLGIVLKIQNPRRLHWLWFKTVKTVP